MGAGDAQGNTCIGAFTFLGVNVADLGYPKPTVNNWAELAGVLRQWVSSDGVPGVGQWVNLSPDVAQGMQSAGIDPTKFLQWLNENDSGAPWPQFLPKPLGTVTPLNVVNVAPAPAASSAAASVTHPASDPAAPPVAPPPAAKPQPAPPPPSSTSTPPSPTLAAPSAIAPAPAPSTTPSAASGPASEPAGVPVSAPVVPSVTVDGTTVPCEVSRTCAATLDRRIAQQSSPAGRVGGLWARLAWWGGVRVEAAAAVLVACILTGTALLVVRGFRLRAKARW